MESRSTKLLCVSTAIFIFYGVALMSDAQSLSPYLVSSGGAFASNGFSISYSIGEPVIATKTSNGLILNQGFQQAFNDSIINITDTTKSPVFYSGISPNNDGKNDTWIIDNITNYKKNTVTIFDRWGNSIWSHSGYNNTTVVWDGTDNNKKPLSTGTYFYVVTAEGKGELAKGWVEITKK